MKKILVTLFILGCFNLNAQQKVTVKMPLADTSKYVQLGHYYGYKQFFKVDSAKVDKNGLLTFNSPDGSWKGGAYVIVPSASKLYDFIYSGTEKDIVIEFDTTDYTNTAKFKNSPENEHTFGYRKLLSAISNRGAELQNKLKEETNPEKAAQLRADLGKLQKEANAELKKRAAEKPSLLSSKIMLMNLEPELPEQAPLLPNGKTDSTFMYRTYKAHFFDNVTFSDERMIRTPFLEKKLEQYFTNLVYQKADSLIKETSFVLEKSKANKEVYRYVLWYLTNKYETSDVIGLDRVVVHLYENYYLKDADWVDADQKTKFRNRLNIIKPVQTGNIMPTLILKDSEGKSHNLNDVKAKYTIVYFYSPTCGHCKDSAPALVKFQDENRSKGIEVLNVSTDPERKLQEMKDFMKTYDTSRMLNLYDPEHKYDFFSNYDVYSTPTLYLLDEQKRILAKRLPIEDINGFISFYEKNK